MSTILYSLLILSNVLLATWVFVILARPMSGARFVLRIMNPKRAMWEPELSHEEAEQLSRIASVLGWIGLAVLAGWSYAVGSYLVLIKM